MNVPDLGTKAVTWSPSVALLANVLFTPVQQRILRLLFGQRERRFQSAELIRLAGRGRARRIGS